VPPRDGRERINSQLLADEAVPYPIRPEIDPRHGACKRGWLSALVGRRINDAVPVSGEFVNANVAVRQTRLPHITREIEPDEIGGNRTCPKKLIEGIVSVCVL
jgi:hypothetical protein